MAKYYPETGEKIRLKDWWDGWCWYGLGMLAWSVFWAVRGWGEWSGGFHIGMAILWVSFLFTRFHIWVLRDTIVMGKIIESTHRSIIESQQRHINLLRGQIK